MRGRSHGGPSPIALGALAFLGGVIVGTLAWSEMMDRCRRDLFCPSPLRRLAALGYLGGRPSAESARLLADYIRWERLPLLRRRARRLLDRVESLHLE